MEPAPIDDTGLMHAGTPQKLLRDRQSNATKELKVSTWPRNPPDPTTAGGHSLRPTGRV